jgi:hypothetical protein
MTFEVESDGLSGVEVSPATEITLSRIETVLSLLQLAASIAATDAEAMDSEHARLNSAVVSSVLSEALAEQRILWLELAPTAATPLDGQGRYRDVTRLDRQGGYRDVTHLDGRQRRK